ncbi:hypothetical protein ACX40Y_16525 [Sphingomonas sp. RS6]
MDTERKDERPDIQQAVEARSDAADAAGGGGTTSPQEPAGAPDGVGGTAGVVKNQESDQQ